MSTIETDHPRMFLGVTWSVFCIALLLCTLRFYIRFLLVRKPWADDILLALALITSIPMMTLLTLHTKHAPERHPTALKYSYAAAITSLISVTLAKISIVLQYIRAFRKPRALSWICWITISFLALWMIAIILATTAFCKVDSAPAWDLGSVEGQCQTESWLAHASAGIAINVLLIGLPIPMLVRMKVPWKQRIVISILIGIGCG